VSPSRRNSASSATLACVNKLARTSMFAGNRGKFLLSMAAASVLVRDNGVRTALSQLVERSSLGKKGAGKVERVEKDSGDQALGITALPTMPERVETPILIIIRRKNAFTVLGLMVIRSAISLLVIPSSKNRRTSCSRAVR
jgi:hypothetical protein